jgi:cysteine desulfurase
VTYLDHNAITPVRPEAEAAVLLALRAFGNPSSVHAAGREARALLDEARGRVAAGLHVHPRDLVFTSGATESATLAIRGALAAAPSGRTGLVVTAVEHPCVLDLARNLALGGTPVQVVPVDRRGVVDLEVLGNAIGPETALVCCMLANNETGVLQPVAGAADLAHAAGALLLCDAVQAAGKIPVDLPALRVDLAAITAQKFGGPRGAGALWIAPGIRLAPLAGGHQERGRRAGTENLPGLAGMGAALDAAVVALPVDGPRIRALRDRLEAGLLAALPGSHVNGAGADRLPNTLSITFPGSDGETLLMSLDLEGICASAGAACTSGSTNPSHVLSAMGLTVDEARATLRLSLGWNSTEADVDHALQAMPAIVRRVRDALAAPGPRAGGRTSDFSAIA